MKHNVRSYFEVTRVLVYIYTKNVTPGNKTLGSHLKANKLRLIYSIKASVITVGILHI